MKLSDEFKARMKSFQGDTTPVSQAEAEWGEAVVKITSSERMYHGGVAGLRPGDLLLTGEDLGLDTRGWYQTVKRTKHWIYFTNCRGLAHFYARTLRLLKYTSGVPNKPGALYLIEPLSTVHVDLCDLRAHRSFGHTPEQASKYGPLSFVTKSAVVSQVLEELPL